MTNINHTGAQVLVVIKTKILGIHPLGKVLPRPEEHTSSSGFNPQAHTNWAQWPVPILPAQENQEPRVILDYVESSK